MSLPVSQYEALLAEVRDLRRKAQRVQQLATPLISNIKSLPNGSLDGDLNSLHQPSTIAMDSVLATVSINYEGTVAGNSSEGTCSEDEYGGLHGAHMSISSEPISHGECGGLSALCHGTWPDEKTMSNSEPLTFKSSTPIHNNSQMPEASSVMSFASSSGGIGIDRVLNSPSLSRRSSQQLEAKVDMVYSLLAMLSGQEHANMGETLLALSANPESCLAMRQSGCIPLLVQMVQSDKEHEAREKAAQALHNLIYSQPDEKIRKREVRIFKLLEYTRAYIEALKSNKEFEPDIASSDDNKHPVQTIAHLMKLSFDEGHRQAICLLGGIHTIANLVEIEHAMHGSTTDESHCILLRRYACMALTNLTFGDSGNKALLCSFREFIRAMVVQLQSPSDELRQVTASVLRNLSWRADSCSKDILREVGSVAGLMKAAMLNNKENTLKSILSALWNLSAHCTENKSEICAVEGALGFLVDMLTYKTPSKSLAIIENSGGILRNISSQIAVRDDYREILRQHNCLQILLDQLKSPSLTIVSNACGTLWNLSAKCSIDQEALWRMGAPTMLRSLNHSKHKMIAMGSSAALKNLLNANPSQSVLPQMDSTALAMDLPALPTLGARRQKALMQSLDQTLSETFDNIEKSIISTDNQQVSTNDFIQKCEKNQQHKSPECVKYADFAFNYETQDDEDYNVNNFVSLNEPSTSHSNETKFKSKIPQNSGSSSLPYMEITKQSKIAIPKRSKQNDALFIKSKPKNIAKEMSSGISECNKNDEKKNINSNDTQSNYYNNSEMDNSVHYKCSTNSSSCSSFDNDQLKQKETDEKDRCSVEDISDGDPPLDIDIGPRILDKKQNKLSVLDEPSKLKAAEGSSMFVAYVVERMRMDSDCDSDMEINYDDQDEKQDFGKEMLEDNAPIYSNADGCIQVNKDEQQIPKNKISTKSKLPVTSGIPLPRTSSTFKQSIAHSLTKFDSARELTTGRQPPIINPATLSTTDGNPFQTSTPIKLNPDISGEPKDKLKEASQIENNMQEDMSIDACRNVAYNTIYTCSSKNSFNAQSLSAETEKLNISQENNSSQMELNVKLLTEREDIAEDLPNIKDDELNNVNTNYSYLNSENCVNFSLECERDRHLERSCEETNYLDNRMLDPDAMIESLDRFTAELVSQASHLQSKDDKYKISDNTWNDDTSPEITFPSVSGSMPQVVMFESNDGSSINQLSSKKDNDNIDGFVMEPEYEKKSNDFSSINTSTLTDSTLIAIEASKMATVFKTESEMMKSCSSVASLELDHIQSPSNFNSLNNNSQYTNKKKSLPPDLIVRRALGHFLNNGSSESLDNHSCTNLDQVNPPSGLMDIIDLEGSMISVASLPSENAEIKADFVINGPIHNRFNEPEFNLNQPLSLLGNNHHSISDLEHINPPSLFNDITDLCNSLADVPTEAIGSETEVFEDCFTHVNEPTIQTEDDVTEFSDAASITPIQSDHAISSPEQTPQKTKNLGTKMTSKQRRNLARDRYKTYTVAAEMIMKEQQEDEDMLQQATETISENCNSENFQSIISSDSTYISPTYNIYQDTTNSAAGERLQPNRNQVQLKYKTSNIKDSDSSGSNSAPQSPLKTKLSIRRNFMQKRLENKDRFKTQTLTESMFATESTSDVPSNEADVHLLVQKEATKLLNRLQECRSDELLDCETLSLVSNDDDSEHNSGNSTNYKTYHKNWGLRKNIPIISQTSTSKELHQIPNVSKEDYQENDDSPISSLENDDDDPKVSGKPKIVKPLEKPEEEEVIVEENQAKPIRGRRKPLYARSTVTNKLLPKTLRPKTAPSSNLVKNVNTTLPQPTTKPNATKPNPVPSNSRISSGYGTKLNTPKTSPVRSYTNSKINSTKLLMKGNTHTVPALDRQGTFTKDGTVSKSRIPAPGLTKPSKILSPKSSKIPSKNTINNTSKPTSPKRPSTALPTIGRSNKTFLRSSSDNRDKASSSSGSAQNQPSTSSNHSLKNQTGTIVKRSSIPLTKQKSNSNNSLNTVPSNVTKQVTSKIASLWKKIEDSKKLQPTKKDNRVWIQGEQRNNVDNKDGVVMRNKTHEDDPERRISRLGSFIVMNENEDRLQQMIEANAVVD